MAGAPDRPSRFTSRPARSSRAWCAAARHVTCAIWHPVTKAKDADAGTPSKSFSQSPQTSSTTAAAGSYLDHSFEDDQILLFGRESAGVPESVHNAADARLCIPMRTDLRSLTIAVAVAMVTGEALRQTRGLGAGQGGVTSRRDIS